MPLYPASQLSEMLTGVQKCLSALNLQQCDKKQPLDFVISSKTSRQ